MAHIRMKKNKGNVEVNVFEDGKKSKSHYGNIITKDPNRIAQVFIDLMIQGFPIEKAIKIFKERMKTKDWMGI